MAKVLVLYYSSYGHTMELAEAVAAGAREKGAEATVKRVPETVPDEVAAKSGYRLDQAPPIASQDELPDYDAIVIGTPTRYGRLCAQQAVFWDQTGGLWLKGALVGKVGAVFCSTGAQHGGQETTIMSGITNLLHHGMVIVGLPYSFKDQLGVDAVHGGSPYGATTVAGPDGSRSPAAPDLAGARFQGGLVAETAAKLFG